LLKFLARRHYACCNNRLKQSEDFRLTAGTGVTVDAVLPDGTASEGVTKFLAGSAPRVDAGTIRSII
jgi:hypothetical protein